MHIFARPFVSRIGIIKMPINYYLLENKINKKEGIYIAKVESVQNANMDKC